MPFKLIGDVTGYVAEVDVNKQLTVVTSANTARVGGVSNYAQNDPGTIVGTQDVIQIEGSADYRMAAGRDSMADTESFCYTAQNTAKHNLLTTTMTASWASGFFNTNASGITTTTTGVTLRTYQVFPIWGGTSTYVETSVAFSTWTTTNATADYGLFIGGASTPYAPTDGVYFRVNSAGLVGVSCYNSTEQSTSTFTFTPNLNQVYKFGITIHKRVIKFWVDNVLMGTLVCPTGVGSVTSSQYLPWAIRHAFVGAASAAQSLKVSDYTVEQVDVDILLPYAYASAAASGMGYQGQSGGTMGTSALYTNSLAAGAGAAATNTTAALGSGLGGQFAVQPTLTAGTDGIISSFQVPASTTTTGAARQLVITGVRVQGLVTTAFTGGPVYYAYSLAFGHTAVSLATAEAASTKASRRVALGYETYVVTAAVGTLGQGVSVSFASPIVVNPGEFVQLVAKNQGTVTSAGVIALLVTFDAHWK